MKTKYRIIHIEDKPEWQESVRFALQHNLDMGDEIVPVSNLEQFRVFPNLEADIYICDRHLPNKSGEFPNDDSWKSIMNILNSCYPEKPVLILSSKPPLDWRKYSNIREVLAKSDFDFGQFRQKVESYMGAR